MSTVLFVGGDERQVRAIQHLKLPSEVVVRSIQPAWNRNWSKPLGQAERAARDVDAIAISTDVPTELGKKLRELARARGIPWVAGRARGSRSISQLIIKAGKLADGR